MTVPRPPRRAAARGRALLAAALLAAAAPALRAQDAGYEPGYGDRFLQTSSPLTHEKGLLETIIQHRFSQPVKDAGGNNLFGLDSGANIGLGIGYAPVKNLAIEAYRGSTAADYEFSLKFTALRPTPNLPLALGARAGVNWLTKTNLEKKSGAFGQALVAWTLFDRVTVAAAPTYVSNTPLFTDVWNVPLVLQVRITKSFSAIGEYVPRNRDLAGSVGQWSAALEKTVWRHRFSLWVGNSGATTIDQMMASDFAGGVRDGNVRLGFNVVRAFELNTD